MSRRNQSSNSMINQNLLWNFVLTSLLCSSSRALLTKAITSSSTHDFTGRSLFVSVEQNDNDDDKDVLIDPIPNSIENAASEIDVIYDEAMRFENHEEDWDEEGQISKYYRRDDDDDINVPIPDENGLRKLLALRFHAYQKRDMIDMQKIDETLKIDHGVMCYAHVWTRQSQPPASELRRRDRVGMNKLKDMYGPTGHPFQHYGGPIDPIFCDLDISQVHTLLSRWMHNREMNRYEEADTIRFELRLHGVEFNETSKLWRADGEKSFPKNTLLNYNDNNILSNRVPHKYKTTAHSTTPSELRRKDLKRIDQLINIRSDTIFRGEDRKAEFMAFELWKTYGVGIDDTSNEYFFPSSEDKNYCNGNHMNSEKQWKPPILPSDDRERQHCDMSSSFESFPPVLFEHQSRYEKNEEPRYTFSGAMIDKNHLRSRIPRERIQYLLQTRKIKLEDRKYIEADAIKHEVFKTYGVTVNDSTLEWEISIEEGEEGHLPL